jgi:hypothetical protein
VPLRYRVVLATLATTQGWPGTFEQSLGTLLQIALAVFLGIEARSFVRSNLGLKPHFRPMRHYRAEEAGN